MPDDRLLKPHEIADMGLIDSLSMHEFTPDQRMVEEALGHSNPLQQQGGGSVTGTVPNGTAQSHGNRSPVSPGFGT